MATEITKISQFILKESSHRNRVLVLCEGEITGSLANLNLQRTDGKRYTRSVKAAKQHDAHFYRKCQPYWWKTTGSLDPVFVNAGSRSEVLKIFFEIIDLHQQEPENSCLDLSKLFALVDLDIQSQLLDVNLACQAYNSMQEIEDVFNELYEQGRCKGLTTYSNHILVTGLIHKEAYFLLPELAEELAFYQPLYNNQALDLPTLYLEIAQDSEYTKDLATHFEHITQRLNQYPDLDCCTLENLQNSWISNYQASDHSETWVNALFLFKKAKPYWEKIHSADIYNSATLKDNLCGVIEKFYRDRFRNKDEVKGEVPADHIPCLFRAIYRIAYETS